ncbi:MULTISPECIES: BlaI/MecI/CopY family transcriptional regulator [Rhodococcus]|uniref:BlaI/MecI/CopY family transcriptional regulator n=1 Tax=Rhodococcus TaxID=1827 RepID=UPI00131F6AAD|nr:BlaI/MecI/CopY family transcriptional regulator [Rhodococcus sp. WAY2]QHE74280.1 Transcriptional regulator, MecI family [Rhodococcus sp. WAY2]
MHGLGELEGVVMDALWRSDEPLRVRDVLEGLTGREPAYTTIQTVMDNLHRKGWVERERQGRAFSYRATRSREQATAAAVRELLATSGDPAGVLMHFAKGSSEQESAILARGLRERTAR